VFVYPNILEYPLAVKLGTITPDGKADVYSYGEDDMVLDGNLVQHLAHFGINVAQMEKVPKLILHIDSRVESLYIFDFITRGIKTLYFN